MYNIRIAKADSESFEERKKLSLANKVDRIVTKRALRIYEREFDGKIMTESINGYWHAHVEKFSNKYRDRIESMASKGELCLNPKELADMVDGKVTELLVPKYEAEGYVVEGKGTFFSSYRVSWGKEEWSDS